MDHASLAAQHPAIVADSSALGWLSGAAPGQPGDSCVTASTSAKVQSTIGECASKSRGTGTPEDTTEQCPVPNEGNPIFGKMLALC